jgi:hypothetical protein
VVAQTASLDLPVKRRLEPTRTLVLVFVTERFEAPWDDAPGCLIHDHDHAFEPLSTGLGLEKSTVDQTGTRWNQLVG